MPLNKTCYKDPASHNKVISQNISAMVREGYPQQQAVAIAMNTARRYCGRSYVPVKSVKRWKSRNKRSKSRSRSRKPASKKRKTPAKRSKSRSKKRTASKKTKSSRR